MTIGSEKGVSQLCVRYCGRSSGDFEQYKSCLEDCFEPEKAGFYEASEMIWQEQEQYNKETLECAQRHAAEAARIVNEKFVRPVNERAVPLFDNADIDDRIIDWKIGTARREVFQTLMGAAGNLAASDPVCLKRGAREIYLNASNNIFSNLAEEIRFNRAIYPHDIMTDGLFSSCDDSGVEAPVAMSVTGGMVGLVGGFVFSLTGSGFGRGGIIGTGVIVGLFAVSAAVVSPVRLLTGPRPITEVTPDNVMDGETSWHLTRHPPQY